ncbi:MAG: ABC transporter ATP-binding protein [Bacteroidota bacterium]
MLRVEGIQKAFGEEEVLSQLTFSLPKASVLSILGRSGSGKTTLLRILAGLEKASAGKVWLGEQEISDWSPQQRNIVYLYQEPLLFPHLNVFENLAFGLRIRKKGTSYIKQRVEQMLTDLELATQAKKMPHQLSGGQRQRVNFGRAIIIEPQVLLLDEPFGALDVETRHKMQQLFQDLRTRHKMTAIFVTHDLKEAMLMGQQLAYMQGGHLKIYANRSAFLNDPATEAGREIQFWEKMQQEAHPKGDAES